MIFLHIRIYIYLSVCKCDISFLGNAVPMTTTLDTFLKSFGVHMASN